MLFYRYHCSKPETKLETPTEEEFIIHFLSADNISRLRRMFISNRQKKDMVLLRQGNTKFLLSLSCEVTYNAHRDTDSWGEQELNSLSRQQYVDYYFELDDQGKLSKLLTYYGQHDLSSMSIELDRAERLTKSALSLSAAWKKPERRYEELRIKATSQSLIYSDDLNKMGPALREAQEARRLDSIEPTEHDDENCDSRPEGMRP